MSSTALVLVLVAAVAHAAITLYGPLALAAIVLDPGAVSATGVAIVAGSGVLHAGYFLALQRSPSSTTLITGALIAVYTATARPSPPRGGRTGGRSSGSAP